MRWASLREAEKSLVGRFFEDMKLVSLALMSSSTRSRLVLTRFGFDWKLSACDEPPSSLLRMIGLFRMSAEALASRRVWGRNLVEVVPPKDEVSGF